MTSRWMSWLALVATLVAFCVVVLGAWTRLVDAGLGCPDWPGCYGFLAVPGSAEEVDIAQARFPHAPVEAHKAWPEMIHRYAAGTLGVLIFAIAGLALWQRGQVGRSLWLALGLAGLVVLQAAFGMWTVTLKLWPQVVTAHLLGGMATLSLLWWLALWRWWHPREIPVRPALRRLALAGLVVTVLQVALGGWVSSNYAALACPDFPTCQGQWWPAMDFADGFNVTQDVGPNYLGGLMDNEARVAIHVTHRLGAVVTTLTLIGLAGLLIQAAPELAALGLAVLAALGVQVALGIANVVWSIPLGVATAHNAGGALLLLVMVTVSYRTLQRGVRSNV